MINGKPEPGVRRHSRAFSASSRTRGASCDAASRTIARLLSRIHHAAIICGDYEVSKRFYTDVLGLAVAAENWRAERQSWKLDLALPDGSQVELFSFPDRPPRPSYPEARGLRHLAFEVDDVARCKGELEA